MISAEILAQHTIRLQIKELPSYHPAESALYIAGSFNGWNPQSEKHQFLRQEDGSYVIDLKLEKGTYEYKVTRGSWDKVECKKGGVPIENRILKVEEDKINTIQIVEWQDRYPAKPRVSTASKNVRVIDTAFWIPQLKRTRRIWIYLPAAYHATGNKEDYPVLYMHDGQNLFDDATSFAGEWGIDEALDTAHQNMIVVGIDHGGDKRLNEYNPYDNARFGKGEGAAYVTFIVKTLKPYIDRHYRTINERDKTIIAGSSMGGLISFYAVLKYPKVFGGAGVFSPSFWVAPDIYDEIRKKGKKVRARIYFYAGKQESDRMVSDLLKAFEALAAVSKTKMTTVIRDEGKHNESTWRNEFMGAINFLLEHPADHK